MEPRAPSTPFALSTSKGERALRAGESREPRAASREPRTEHRGRSRVGLGFLAGVGLLLVLVLTGRYSAAAAESPAADLEERVYEVSAQLRCVVCQNLSVADSPSDLAKEMRNLVREQLQQGKSPEEVKAYFVSRYGDFVLLEPPKRGFNLLVWGLPFAALLVGAGGVYLVARRWAERGQQAAPPPDPAYAERVRRELREREGPSGS